jgi:hypothetical protein
MNGLRNYPEDPRLKSEYYLSLLRKNYPQILENLEEMTGEREDEQQQQIEDVALPQFGQQIEDVELAMPQFGQQQQTEEEGVVDKFASMQINRKLLFHLTRVIEGKIEIYMCSQCQNTNFQDKDRFNVIGNDDFVECKIKLCKKCCIRKIMKSINSQGPKTRQTLLTTSSRFPSQWKGSMEGVQQSTLMGQWPSWKSQQKWPTWKNPPPHITKKKDQRNGGASYSNGTLE